MTLGDLPKDVKVGDKALGASSWLASAEVVGKVAAVQTYGVFFNIGASRQGGRDDEEVCQGCAVPLEIPRQGPEELRGRRGEVLIHTEPLISLGGAGGGA